MTFGGLFESKDDIRSELKSTQHPTKKRAFFFFLIVKKNVVLIVNTYILKTKTMIFYISFKPVLTYDYIVYILLTVSTYLSVILDTYEV